MLLDRRVLSDVGQTCNLEPVPLSSSPADAMVGEREKKVQYENV